MLRRTGTSAKQNSSREEGSGKVTSSNISMALPFVSSLTLEGIKKADQGVTPMGIQTSDRGTRLTANTNDPDTK